MQGQVLRMVADSSEGRSNVSLEGAGLIAWSITEFLKQCVHAAKFRLLVTYYRSAGHTWRYRTIQLLSEEMHLVLDRVLGAGADVGSRASAQSIHQCDG